LVLCGLCQKQAADAFGCLIRPVAAAKRRNTGGGKAAGNSGHGRFGQLATKGTGWARWKRPDSAAENCDQTTTAGNFGTVAASKPREGQA